MTLKGMKMKRLFTVAIMVVALLALPSLVSAQDVVCNGNACVRFPVAHRVVEAVRNIDLLPRCGCVNVQTCKCVKVETCCVKVKTCVRFPVAHVVRHNIPIVGSGPCDRFPIARKVVNAFRPRCCR